MKLFTLKLERLNEKQKYEINEFSFESNLNACDYFQVLETTSYKVLGLQTFTFIEALSSRFYPFLDCKRKTSKPLKSGNRNCITLKRANLILSSLIPSIIKMIEMI